MVSYDINKLERARRVKGWSKAQLARALGITPSAISFIWKGQSKNSQTMKQITDILGLQIEDVLIDESKEASHVQL